MEKRECRFFVTLQQALSNAPEDKLLKTTEMRMSPFQVLALSVCLTVPGPCTAQSLRLTDKGYLHRQSVDVMVYSNPFSAIFYDEKRSGIDIVHHDVMTITNGGVRLNPTPEQWDLVPEMLSRKVNKTTGEISVRLRYDEYDFESTINVMPRGQGIRISVVLDKPVPKILEGKAGFNLEFLPSAYWNKTYLADGKPSYFPRYPFSDTGTLPDSEKVTQVGGFSTIDNRGFSDFIVPKPLAAAHELVMAPEDEEQMCIVRSDSTLLLYDGRITAQNGWFVVRSLLPAGATGKVLEWYVEPKAKAGWMRKPNIGFSQVGYLPGQKKTAVIELDAEDTAKPTATLYRISKDGGHEVAKTMDVTEWGNYLRYHYVTADFSSVATPGLYFIKYDDQTTNAFPISQDVYDRIGDASTDVWLPVQMDHMMVREGYRVWHGAPYLDDVRQAPENTTHFDNYAQGKIDSPYKSMEFIPGFDHGGWFDAGDFDIETNSHCSALLSLANAWETFRPMRDETYVNQDKRLVVMHRPDGTPDLLQQIEHGVLPVVNMVEKTGHSCRGINPRYLYQYNRLGDVCSITDNQPMTGDERWLFTDTNPMLEMSTIAALASASQALKGCRDSLARRCLNAAEMLWQRDSGAPSKDDRMSRFMSGAKLEAALKLYKATGNKEFLRSVKTSISTLDDHSMALALTTAVEALPYLDKKMMKHIEAAAIEFKAGLDSLEKNNPYGVMAYGGRWGSSGMVVRQGITAYWLHKYFPTVVSKEDVYKTANFLFGCHPYSNLSFVMGVGVRPKERSYASNRADFSFIAGGVVPGLLLLQPDFAENKDDWPFFWGQNECTIAGVADYIYFADLLKDLSSDDK